MDMVMSDYITGKDLLMIEGPPEDGVFLPGSAYREL